MSIEVEATHGFLFANRCKTLPLVNSTCSLFNEYYNKVKEANRLTKFTIGLAESTIKTSFSLANPVLEKFNGPLHVIDEIANRQLKKLETAFPILNEETDSVVNQGKMLLHKTAEPALSKLNKIEYRCENIKNYGMEKVTSIKKAREQLKAKAILKKLLDASEYLIEKYLLEDRVYVVDDKLLMDYYHSGSSLTRDAKRRDNEDISNRIKGLTCTVYSALQKRCLRKINTTIHSFDAFLDRISQLVHLLDKQKTYLKTQFKEKMSNGFKKVHFCKEYLEALAKQMMVQDGRSLNQVNSLEERAKIILRRSISNILTAFSLINQKLNVAKMNTRLHEKLSKLVSRMVKVYRFLQPNFMLSQKSHKTYQMIIQNVQGTTYEFVKSFSKYPVVAWLLPNSDVIGIVEFDDGDNGNNKKAKSNELCSPRSNKTITTTRSSDSTDEDEGDKSDEDDEN